MQKETRRPGISTLMNHTAKENPLNAAMPPIYQASAFTFDSAESVAAAFMNPMNAYIYSRWRNPNQVQLAEQIATLEALDLLADSGRPLEEVVSGMVFSSGMAAVTSAILAAAKPGQTIIAQEVLYASSYTFLKSWAERSGFQTIFVHDSTPEKWEEAFAAHPEAVLAYAESPANPTLVMTDLAAVAEIAHRHGAKLMIDNTFATPYCQRPLSLGADVIVHSTTKFLAGHGVVTGGAVVSTDKDYINGPLYENLKTLGGTPGPMDCWLTSLGLKTFELRMQRHCDNALAVARYLAKHPAVAQVFYPGLEDFSQHALALRQMSSYGGMVAFELKGGLEAGVNLVNRVKLCALMASLGNAETIITHPASMTHFSLTPETRKEMGIAEGLVRLSVGIENIEDTLSDLEQALQ